MRTVDLAIVGAGPAGTAAALAARAADPELEILLIDRAVFPRDKTCGDGIGPECAVALSRLGVAHVLDDVPPVTRVEVRAPDGGEVSGTVPRPGWVLPRRELDARLYAAAEAAGVETVRHNVRSVEPERDAVVIDELCRARWVIGADGANSNMRRAAGWGNGAEAPMGLAMRGYGTGPPLDALLIRFVPEGWPAYAWAFPIGNGAVNVGYGTFDRSRVDRREQLIAAIATHLPEYEVEPSTLRAHHLPLASVPPALGAGRLLLAGDAANLVHPLTGEGITYALVSGRLAGTAVARAAAGVPHPGRVYEAMLSAELGRHLRHLRLAARLFRHRTPVNVSVAAARDDARMLGALAEFSLGIGVITPSLSWALTRAWMRRRRG